MRPVAFAYPFGAYGADRTNDPGIAAVLREEVARLYTVGFHQDDQETVPLVTLSQDLLRLRRLEVEDWSGRQLLQHIERARQLSGVGSPGPGAAGSDLVGGPTSSGTTTTAPTTQGRRRRLRPRQASHPRAHFPAEPSPT